MPEDINKITFEVDQTKAVDGIKAIEKELDAVEQKVQKTGQTTVTVTDKSRASHEKLVRSLERRVEFAGLDKVQTEVKRRDALLSQISEPKLRERVTAASGAEIDRLQKQAEVQRREEETERLRQRAIKSSKELTEAQKEFDKALDAHNRMLERNKKAAEDAAAAEKARLQTASNIVERAQYRSADALGRIGMDRTTAVTQLRGVGGTPEQVAALNKEFDKLVANQEKSNAVAARSKLASNLRESADALDGFANKMLVVNTAIVGGLVYIGNLAAGLERTKISFETLLGSKEAGEAFFGSIQKYAQQSIIPLDQLAESAQRALALGFKPEDALRVVKASNAVAAAMGGGAELANRVTLALGQMTAKQKVSAEEMRQLSEAGVRAWQMLADAAGKTVPEAMKMAEKGMFDANIAVKTLTDSILASPLGAVEQRVRTETLTGQIAAFRIEVTQLALDMQQSLLPVGKKIVGMMKDLVTAARGLAEAWRNLPSLVKTLLTDFGGILLALPLLLKGFAALGRGLAFFAEGGTLVRGVTSLVTLFGATELGAAGVAAAIPGIGLAIAGTIVAIRGAQELNDYFMRKQQEDLKKTEDLWKKNNQQLATYIEEYRKGKIIFKGLPTEEDLTKGTGPVKGLVRDAKLTPEQIEAERKRQAELLEQSRHLRGAAEAKAAEGLVEIQLRYQENLRRFRADGAKNAEVWANIEATKIAEINTELTKRHNEEVKKRLAASKEAGTKGIEQMERAVKDMGDVFDDAARERVNAWKDFSRINQENLMAAYDVRQTALDVDKEKQLAELAGKEVGNLKVRQKVSLEQERLQIEIDYAQKSLEVQKAKLRAERDAELAAIPFYAQIMEQRREIEQEFAGQIFDAQQQGYKEAADFLIGERDRAIQAIPEGGAAFDAKRIAVIQQFDNRIKALSLGTENTIAKERIETTTKTNQIVYQNYQDTFNKIKSSASSLLDQLFARTHNWGDLMMNILKAAILTPLKEIASTWIALMFTGNKGVPAGSRGGTTPGGIFGWLMGMGRGGGGGGTGGGGTGGGGGGGGFNPFGGWGWGSFGGTPPFLPAGTGGGGGGGGFGGGGGGTGGGTGGTGSGGTGGGGFGGFGSLFSLAGLKGSFGQMKGLLSSLGNLGRNMDILGNKMGSVPGTLGAKFPGVGGTAGGIMLLAGAGLVAGGLAKGGWMGVGMTTAGGALIGAKFGGPVGAAIGAGVGFIAGLIRLQYKSAQQKMTDKIKQVYGISISKELAAQFVEIAKSQYGGDLNMAVYSPQVRELVQLYSLATGQKTQNMPRPMYPLTLAQSQGVLSVQPVYSGGTVVPSPYVGPTTPVGGSVVSQNVFVQLDPQQSTDLFQGKVVQVIQSNPDVVSRTTSRASRTGVNRNANRAPLLDPLTTMS
jgi:tape measure domain-containing protein